jgi:hypothetical protein
MQCLCFQRSLDDLGEGWVEGCGEMLCNVQEWVGSSSGEGEIYALWRRLIKRVMPGVLFLDLQTSLTSW